MGTRFQPIYVSMPEAGVLLGVSSRTVGRLLDQGVLPYIKPSNHRRIKRDDVLAYRDRCRVGVEPIQETELAFDHLA